MGDSFVKAYIDDLLTTLRTSVLLQLMQPYTRITIPFISQVSGPTSLSSVLAI